MAILVRGYSGGWLTTMNIDDTLVYKGTYGVLGNTPKDFAYFHLNVLHNSMYAKVI